MTLESQVGDFEAFAARVPLFNGLPGATLRAVGEATVPFEARAGDVLFRQGDAADGLYLLVEGEVSITRRLPGDDIAHLAHLGVGELIGEMGLLDERGRSATATAHRNSKGYFLSRDRFAGLRATRHDVAYPLLTRLLHTLCHRTSALLGEINAIVERQPELALEMPMRSATETREGSATLPRATILRGLPLFRTFPPAMLEEFVAQATVLSLPVGHVLFRPGHTPRGCYVVVRGALALAVLESSTQRRLQVAVLGPGQIAGQIGLILDGTHALLCTVREPSLVLHISREYFAAMRDDGGPVASRFLDALTLSTTRLLRKAGGHVTRLHPDRIVTLATDDAPTPDHSAEAS